MPTQLSVLHVTFADGGGGAARAAYRLHAGLGSAQVNSRLFVFRKTGDDASVVPVSGRTGWLITKVMPRLDRMPLRFYPGHAARKTAAWSLGWFPHPVARQLNALVPDVVNLHWIGGGFVPIGSVPAINKPVVWTLHDEWAFTGGCHYAGDCDRFVHGCGQCPQLGSSSDTDLSRQLWRMKHRAWERSNLTVVAPSRWMAEQAGRSSLLRHVRTEVIPNCIDTAVYRPIERKAAREILGLPVDKHLILFGAMFVTQERRKGFHLLLGALQHLAAAGWGDKAELVIFGATAPPKRPDFGLRDHYLGHVFDDNSLALLYSAADVFVLPSMEDNLPNTVMEALACGTPAIAFAVGGLSDLIDHQDNGYLARPFDLADLAEGLRWILSDEDRRRRLAQQARKSAVRKYALGTIAEQYKSLYLELSARLPARTQRV